MMEQAVVTPGTGGLTRFVASVLLIVSCFGASYYAAGSARHSTFSTLLWRYLSLATAVGGLFGVFSIIVTIGVGGATLVAVRGLFGLFFIIFLALSMRELYYQAPYRSSGSDGWISLTRARRLETIFMVIVIIEFGIAILIGLTRVSQTIQLLASLAFTLYGVSFAHSMRNETLSSGTVIDSVLTYTIAVLLCIGIGFAVESGAVVGLPDTTIDSAVNILTVMGASFLISLIIRLKQNVEAVR
ncbi:hypothetical protein HUB97_11010 [Halorubraceae archaeon YAN]|nr:hypothetical protein [Halorubraceae archaeon YAN]